MYDFLFFFAGKGGLGERDAKFLSPRHLAKAKAKTVFFTLCFQSLRHDTQIKLPLVGLGGSSPAGRGYPILFGKQETMIIPL